MTDETQEETQEETNEPQAEQAEAAATPSLGISDLVLVANIIQAVSQRGAIRANEMATVGNLYNKLTAFLTANGAVAAPQADDAEEQTGDTDA